MGVYTHVANLWFDPKDGVTFSGVMTLPEPLPAGVGLRVIAVPQPLRTRKEKWELHVEIPLPPPPPYTGPDDIIFKGEIMQQYFRPPRPPGKRSKILLWGDSGSGKTKSALGFPKCAYIDNHGSAEQYESAYPDHLFAHPDGPDATMGAVTALRDPGGCLTVVMDDATTYWDQVQIKWSDLFEKAAEIERASRRILHLPTQRLIHLNAAESPHPTADCSDLNVDHRPGQERVRRRHRDSDFMKVIGEIFAGERNLVYEFDYIRLSYEDGKRFATVNKQRVPAGCKPLPERFEFIIDEQGNSTLFQVLQQYVNPQNWTAPAHQVKDPVREEIPQSDTAEYGVRLRPPARS
jgi:hypothetical protein